MIFFFFFFFLGAFFVCFCYAGCGPHHASFSCFGLNENAYEQCKNVYVTKLMNPCGLAFVQKCTYIYSEKKKHALLTQWIEWHTLSPIYVARIRVKNVSCFLVILFVSFDCLNSLAMTINICKKLDRKIVSILCVFCFVEFIQRIYVDANDAVSKNLTFLRNINYHLLNIKPVVSYVTYVSGTYRTIVSGVVYKKLHYPMTHKHIVYRVEAIFIVIETSINNWNWRLNWFSWIFWSRIRNNWYTFSRPIQVSDVHSIFRQKFVSSSTDIHSTHTLMS